MIRSDTFQSRVNLHVASSLLKIFIARFYGPFYSIILLPICSHIDRDKRYIFSRISHKGQYI